MCPNFSSESLSGYSDGSSVQASHSRQWLRLSLLTALACLMLIGCENVLPSIFAKTPELYIPEGKCMEIREGCKIKGWRTGADGKPEKCFFRAYPRCNVGVPTTPKPVPVKESEIK